VEKREMMQSNQEEARKTILMAISDSTLRYQYSSRLASEGFSVANVSDAIECLDALRCRAFDILVVEMELPSGRGEGIVNMMSYDPQIQTIPAVIIEIPDDSLRTYPETAIC
jgi:CheY-like chemotaxis protein